MFRFSDKFKRLISLLVALLLVLLAFSTVIFNMVASADNEAELKQKQQSLSGDKSNIQSEISGLESEKKSVMEEKRILDEQVSVLEDDISVLDAQIEEYQAQIDVVSVELEEATVAAENQYEAYKTRVRVMYENGSTGYLDILFSSENIGDFFDRLEIVKQITAYDSNMSKKLKEKKEEIQTKKEEIEKLQQELIDSKEVIEDKKSVLDSKMAERDAMIQKIEGNVAELEKQLEAIEAEEARVRSQLAKLSGDPEPYAGGTMSWPTPSCKYITSYYGWRLHPVLGYEKLHTGIDIGASNGAKIIAANSGTVITATYNNAYGNYVVINHGGGVCTLYAHQSTIAVSVGQYVNEGDVIGYVGSTGYSTGPHLHFEVIINGATTDPLGYIS